MPRYYFDITDRDGRSTDREGQELGTFEDARKLAVVELSEIIRDDMPDGQREAYVVVVRSEQNMPLYVATAMMLGETLVSEQNY